MRGVLTNTSSRRLCIAGYLLRPGESTPVFEIPKGVLAGVTMKIHQGYLRFTPEKTHAVATRGRHSAPPARQEVKPSRPKVDRAIILPLVMQPKEPVEPIAPVEVEVIEEQAPIEIQEPEPEPLPAVEVYEEESDPEPELVEEEITSEVVEAETVIEPEEPQVEEEEAEVSEGPEEVSETTSYAVEDLAELKKAELLAIARDKLSDEELHGIVNKTKAEIIELITNGQDS